MFDLSELDLLCERTISSAKNRSMRFSCFLQVCLAASKMSSVEVQNVRILETSFFIKNIFSPLNLNQCRKKNLYKKWGLASRLFEREPDREIDKNRSTERNTVEQFCEHHTLSELICRKKHVFRSRFRDSDLGSFSIVDLVQTRNPICLVAD